jgi:hypothetical protein
MGPTIVDQLGVSTFAARHLVAVPVVRHPGPEYIKNGSEHRGDISDIIFRIASAEATNGCGVYIEISWTFENTRGGEQITLRHGYVVIAHCTTGLPLLR